VWWWALTRSSWVSICSVRQLDWWFNDVLRVTCRPVHPTAPVVKHPAANTPCHQHTATGTTTSGFYPYTWWAQLAPSEKWGSFDSVVNQNFPPIFHGQTTPLTKLPPIFTPPIFQSTLLTKLSLEGKVAQNGWGKLSQKLGGGTWAQKWGEVAPNFDSRYGEIETTDYYHYCTTTTAASHMSSRTYPHPQAALRTNSSVTGLVLSLVPSPWPLSWPWDDVLGHNTKNFDEFCLLLLTAWAENWKIVNFSELCDASNVSLW